MVFKPKPKEEAGAIVDEVVEEEEAKEEAQTPTEEAEPSTEEAPTEEPPVVGYPVFLTEADVNKMIYENNQMLRLIVESIQK